MQAINSITQLNEAIIQLETKQAADLLLLKTEFKRTTESLKPANLIRNTFKSLVSPPDLKGNLLDAGIGLAAGFLTKKVVAGNSFNPLKQIMGSILQVVVTKLVSKNTTEIKAGATKLVSALLHKKTTKPE